MKRFGIIALAAASLAMAANAEGVRQRQHNQQVRITQGVRSGSLTRPETARLERQEAALHREIARDAHDGPGLTPRERVKIQHQENRLSREIRRAKHNGRTR